MANDANEVDIYCNNVTKSHTTVSLITYLRRYIYVHKKLDRLDHCAMYSNKKVLVTN